MSSRQCKFFLYIIDGEATEAQRAEVVKRFLKTDFGYRVKKKLASRKRAAEMAKVNTGCPSSKL